MEQGNGLVCISDGRKQANCCPGEQCSHAELAHLETPDDPIEHRVELAARFVASTCPSLNSEQLRTCFTRLFQITSDCQLYDLFRASYRTERAAMDEL